MQAFVKSGTPSNRTKYFRDLFEEGCFTLTSSTHMSQLIPFVIGKEYKSVSREILGKELSIIFDGTTRDGEALAVLARFVQDWDVKVGLMRFQLVKSSVNDDKLATIIIEVLHRKLNVPQGCVLAAMSGTERQSTPRHYKHCLCCTRKCLTLGASPTF